MLSSLIYLWSYSLLWNNIHIISMTSFLLWLYCVNLLVVYLESRWEKVKSDALAARFVSAWRHWSDNVLISRPLPSGNHSQEQEVCSGGDSRCLRAVMGQMSPGWQLTHLWAVTTSVTTYLRKAMVLMLVSEDDFLSSHQHGRSI